MDSGEEKEEAIERAKKLWKSREKAVSIDRKDFKISKNIASGNGISEDAISKYGKNRAIVNTPILDPVVNAIAYKFDSNPFSFKLPKQFEAMADRQELSAALSNALREIVWDGISYIYAYYEAGAIKFRVLDNMNVVWGRCRLADGSDCKEALYIDKISKSEVEKQYPELDGCNIRSNSIVSYSGPELESDEYEEATYWEQTESGVKAYKFIGSELAAESLIPIPRLPLVRVCGKKVRVAGGRINWRGIPYPVRDKLVTLTYISSLLQERIAIAPNFNFWVAQESASDHETAKQFAKMNTMPRAVGYYRALDGNGQPIPPPIKVDKSAGIDELMAHIETLRSEINSVVGGAAAAPPLAGTETAESVLMRRESKENATDEFLWNLLIGAQGVAAVIESLLAFLASEKAKESGMGTAQYLAELGLQNGISVTVSDSIFEKAKQAADSQKLTAFIGFITQNPGSMDFADALLETLDLGEENKNRAKMALETRKKKEQQNMEQLMQQGQQQEQQLRQAQAENQALQQQIEMMGRQAQDLQHANMVMEADSKAKVIIKEMELKNQLAIKQMEMDFKYAELNAKTSGEAEKNEIAAAKAANEQIGKIDNAMRIAEQHPTKGAFL